MKNTITCSHNYYLVMYSMFLVIFFSELLFDFSDVQPLRVVIASLTSLLLISYIPQTV